MIETADRQKSGIRGDGERESLPALECAIPSPHLQMPQHWWNCVGTSTSDVSKMQ